MTKFVSSQCKWYYNVKKRLRFKVMYYKMSLWQLLPTIRYKFIDLN